MDEDEDDITQLVKDLLKWYTNQNEFKDKIVQIASTLVNSDKESCESYRKTYIKLLDTEKSRIEERNKILSDHKIPIIDISLLHELCHLFCTQSSPLKIQEKHYLRSITGNSTRTSLSQFWISKIFKRTTTPHDFVVYHGVGEETELASNLTLKSVSVGEKIKIKTDISTTLDPSATLQFLDEKSFILKITIPKDSPFIFIPPFSQFPFEFEILFPPFQCVVNSEPFVQEIPEFELEQDFINNQFTKTRKVNMIDCKVNSFKIKK